MMSRFYPFVFAEGRGATAFDVDGNAYLDFVAAASSLPLGYRHPRVRDAVVDALDTAWSQMHSDYPALGAIALAERLCELVAPAGGDPRAWFGLSGSDANDCLARLVTEARGGRIISFEGSYHGQTSLSAALSHHGGEELAPGSVKVPYPNPYRCRFGPCERSGCSLRCLEPFDAAVAEAADQSGQTAVLIEVVQCDGGVVVPPRNVLPAIERRCRDNGVLLLIDEVKTGLGRTGRMFAHEESGVHPDAVSLGKGLGGGLPISAVVGRADVLDADMSILYTLGAAPPMTAAALATLDVIAAERLAENAAITGRRLADGLEELQRRHETIGDVRGSGLLVGVELVSDRATKTPAADDAAKVVYRAFELGLLVRYMGVERNVLELTPPLIVGGAEVDQALAILEEAFADVAAGRVSEASVAAYRGWS